MPAGEFQVEIQKTETRARISTNTERYCSGAVAGAVKRRTAPITLFLKRSSAASVSLETTSSRAVYSVANAMKYVPRPQ
ncbi:hypothetical protein X769_05250 [Mesorhizobium sp. LSJC268A00]|nr:hypothetical protein X769_05250 [Mesorhizobium sp. LSJC268A00]ESZ17647.1 hypothetical protein X735_06015 [Mesorhizobium sp. L2C085B000]ESZ45315.1 hypothetical protein X731_18620 [Mesorhizobium sp. L2C054A000]